MQRLLLTPILLCFSLFTNAQSKPLLTTADSITIAVFNVQTKQMTTLEGAPYKKQLGKKTLSAKESDKLMKLLGTNSTFQNDRAMLDHHNIELQLHSKEGTQNVFISTFTWNIAVFNNKNAEGDFYKKLTKKGRKAILKLLANNNLLSLINEEDILKD